MLSGRSLLTAASGLVVAVRMYETHRPITFDVDPARTVLKH